MFAHKSVLKEEAIDYLNIKPHGTYVDCTLGGGGHAVEIVSKLNEGGQLIAFDQDENALNAAQNRLKPYRKKFMLIHANFRNLKDQLTRHGIKRVEDRKSVVVGKESRCRAQGDNQISVRKMSDSA